MTITIHPIEELPTREFALLRDEYGARIVDVESGLSVTLDWNGEELKAFITPETGSEPRDIYTFRP